MPFDNPNLTAQPVLDSDASRLMRRAWALIDAPHKWTQGMLAQPRRLAHLPMVSIDDYVNAQLEMVTVESTEHMAFCSVGALHQAMTSIEEHAQSRPSEQALYCLYATLPPSAQLGGSQPGTFTIMSESVADYNDTRDWATVAKWWRKAMALAARRDMLPSYHQAS